MSHYGFDNSQSFGDINQTILENNRFIRSENLRRIQEHQEDITNSKNAVSNLNTQGRETATMAEAVGGQIASKGKDIEAVAKVVKSAPEIATAVLNTTEDMMGDMGAISKFRDPADTTKLYEGAVDFLKGAGAKGVGIAERAKSVGKIGGLATGLTIGAGALDAYDDISTGKIQGANTAEKVANVAGMVSGGLEAVGTALDLTGVGAPVGVALNLLGGITSLVGAGAEIKGEEEEKLSAQEKVQQITQQQPKLLKQEAVQVGGLTGTEVKSSN